MSAERVLALVVALTLVLGCGLEVRRATGSGEGIATVLALFLAVWGISLGLFAIPWVRYDRTSVSTWIAVYGSLATFSIGCLLARRALRGRSFAVDTNWREFDPQRLRRLWVAAALLGLVGFAGYVRAVDAVIGWHAIFTHPGAARVVQSSSQRFKDLYGSFTLLMYMNHVGLLLWTIGLRTGAFSGRWWIARLLGALAIPLLLLTANRQLIFILGIWIVAFHLLWRPPTHIGRTLARVGAGGVLLVAIFLALGAGKNSSASSHPEITRALTTQTASVLALPYVYVTGDIPLLSKLAADPIRPRTHGEMTVLPLAKLAHAAGLIGTPPEETGAFYPIPFDSFNSSSWLGPFLLDFGLVGCLVLPLACGMLFTATVTRAQRGRSLIWLWVGSVAMYSVAFTPLNNQLTISLTWELALLGPLVVLLCSAGPGPLDRVRALAARLTSAPLGARVGLILVAGVSLLGVGLARAGIVGPRTPTVRQQLDSGIRLAERTRRGGSFPRSAVLATRLQAAQPALTYVPLLDPSLPPRETGVVGVFASQDWVALSARDASGRTLQVSWPPGRERRQLLADGDFSRPLVPAWITIANGAALIARPELVLGGHALEVSGTGRTASGATLVAQHAGPLPDSSRGATYRLIVRAQRLALKQTIPVVLRATYADGSYGFAAASAPGGTTARGIPPGNDRGVRPYVATLTATRQLRSLTAFLAEIGPGSLQGAIRFTGASLELSRP